MPFIIHSNYEPDPEEESLAEWTHAFWVARPSLWEEQGTRLRGWLRDDSRQDPLAPRHCIQSLLDGPSPRGVQGGAARDISLRVLFIERLVNDDTCEVPGLDRYAEGLAMETLRAEVRWDGSIRLRWKQLLRDPFYALRRQGELEGEGHPPIEPQQPDSSESSKNQPKRRKGRRPEHKEEDDLKILDDYKAAKSSRNVTRAELEDDRGWKRGAIERAYDRQRRRDERRKN